MQSILEILLEAHICCSTCGWLQMDLFIHSFKNCLLNIDYELRRIKKNDIASVLIEHPA